MPGRLGLARGDADFLSYPAIQERGFANIGPAHNRNYGTAMAHDVEGVEGSDFFYSSKTRAAWGGGSVF